MEILRRKSPLNPLGVTILMQRQIITIQGQQPWLRNFIFYRLGKTALHYEKPSIFTFIELLASTKYQH